MTIGIYKISSNKSLKVYIGSSINIEKRFRDHIDSLLKGDHHSSKLQAHFTKESPELTLTVLEKCNEHELSERESFYIKQYKSYRHGFNCTLNTKRRCSTKDSLNYIKLVSLINKLKLNNDLLDSKMKFTVRSFYFTSQRTSYNLGRAYKLLVYIEHFYKIGISNVVIDKFSYNVSQKQKVICKLNEVKDFAHHYECIEIIPEYTYREFIRRAIDELLLSCRLKAHDHAELHL
jgi:group I intron endonuclease